MGHLGWVSKQLDTLNVALKRPNAKYLVFILSICLACKTGDWNCHWPIGAMTK
jgi:hypothetical protein